MIIIAKRKKKQFWYIMPAYVVFHKLLILSQTQFLIYKRHTISTFPDCFKAAAAAAKSLQLCQTLCDPIDGSPPGSAVPGILQTRTLEWVAVSFSNAWKWKVKVKSFSHVWLSGTPWTAAYQAPPSMGFSRQEYWSGLPLPSPHFEGDTNIQTSAVVTQN